MMETPSDQSAEALRRQSSSIKWNVLGKKIPKGEIVFFCQVVILYTVILVSVYNLSTNSDKNSNLWTSLMCSCLGYILPNPTISSKKPAADP